VLYFRIYYVLNVWLVYLALWGSVLQHPTSVMCLVIVTSSCRLHTIRRVMWSHDVSPMQWQQSVICFGECGSACSPRDRLGQPSLTSAITVVCVSLIQESKYIRKQATSATVLYPSLTLQNVMIPCTDNEFDFRLMYTGLWLNTLLWGLLRNKTLRRDILPTSSGSKWECSYIILTFASQSVHHHTIQINQ
jgi:hypothetical protein